MTKPPPRDTYRHSPPATEESLISTSPPHPEELPADGADGEGPGSTATATRWSIPGDWATRIEIALPILLFVVATFSGATTSSMGNNLLREDPAKPLESTWGQPLPIRSDEWLTQVPIELGVLATGASTRSSLAQEPDLIYQISSGGIFESVMFFEGNLLRLGPHLPDAWLFAAFRAFPTLLLLVGLPTLLRRLGASRPMSWLGVVLCLMAPASLWWSFMPIRILGFAAAGSLALVLARDRMNAAHLGQALALSSVAGLLLARLASYYVPWSLTVGLPLVLATVAWLLWADGPTKNGLVPVICGGAVGAAVLGGMIYNNLPALNAELATEYPGLRRSTGQARDAFSLFGAPGLTGLEQETAPLLLNQSELTSGFLICAIWAALLWGRLRTRCDTSPAGSSPAERHALGASGRYPALLGLALPLAVLTMWVTVNLGSLGERLPLLNLVPSIRVAQTIGYPSALLAVLVLSQLKAPPTTRTAVGIGGACALVTAYAISDLQRALVTISFGDLVLATAVTGIAIALLTRFPNDWRPVAALSAVLLATGLSVNPIAFGLGDLRRSEAAGVARNLASQAAEEQVLVATDHLGVSGLLVANGVPSLTGYQVTGPVTEEWITIDPDRQYEFNWNRGASYVRAAFDQQRGADAVITNPTNDQILISIHPCDLREAGVGIVITPGARDESCLQPLGQFTWGGLPQNIYSISEP